VKMSSIVLRRAALGAAAAATAVLVTACGGGSGDHNASGATHNATTAPAAAPSAGSSAGASTFNEADVAFAQHMIVHHQQAVEMSALADSRASSAQVKELAGKIKAAQGPEITTMMSEADMKKLTDAKGSAFDKQFLTMMIGHHEGAITMANDESAKGSNPEAKALAGKIVADQQAEITEMKDLLTKV
jgi:uncharacterized protein (DUF305 family)